MRQIIQSARTESSAKRSEAVEQLPRDAIASAGLGNAARAGVDQLLPSSPPETARLKGLHETIELICADAARAELWASALNAFARPVPDYDRMLLPVEQRQNS